MKVFLVFLIVGAIFAVAIATNDGHRYRYNGRQYGGYSPYRSSRYGQQYGRGQYTVRYGYNYGYKRVRCPKLDDPDNGEVELSGTAPGSRAVHSCDTGFVLVGNRVRRCQRNGRWSGSAPTCERVDCGSLDDIRNGDVNTRPDTRFGSTATYTCDTGFRLAGRSQRECQADGNWSGREPICVRVDCGGLDDIDNGRVAIDPDTRFQSTASYSCNPGFRLVGQQQRQCQADGNWSGREPVCVRVDCGPLDDIPNGRVIIRPNTRFQSTASYSCNQGFQLVGQQQRQCQADGNWSGREPVCVRVDCGPLNDIENGRVSISPNTRFQSTATYSCNLGFQLVGQQQRSCLASAQWSGQEPSCVRINCGQLPDIENGRVSIAPDTRFLSIATYTCNPGFFLVGNVRRRCEADGSYSGSEPSCQPRDCGPLDDPENGDVVTVPGTTFNSVAIYTCFPGFRLSGVNRRRCTENGVWSAEEPTCVAIDCGLLPNPENGAVRFNPGTTFGSTATFSCRPGFRRVGNRERQCQANSEWSGSQPTCAKISCPKLPVPKYGKIHSSGYYVGDHAIFSCSHGYSVFGKSRLVCLHTGAWSDSVPSCKEDPSYYDPDYVYDGPPINDKKDDDYYDDSYDY